MPTRFNVFTRTWWKHNPAYPNGREPQAGPKHHMATVDTEKEAREMCRKYNQTHKPGYLSRKAEYEEA